MKFHVDLVGTANVTVITDADSAEDAAEIASEHIPALCHQCAGGLRGRPSLDLGAEFNVVAVTTDDGDQVVTGDSEVVRLAQENDELRAHLTAVRALIDQHPLGESALIPATELRAALDA